MLGESGGPDTDCLAFDLDGPFNSPWNQTAFRILAEKFEEQRRRLPASQRLPARPRLYVEKMMMEKFKRCKSFWAKAKPRTTESGFQETSKELEERLSNEKRDSLKTQRQNTRRLNVGLFRG